MLYDALDRQEDCYRYFEKAMIADPDDLDYPMLMAKQILNEHLVRTSDEDIEAVNGREAAAAAAPFILFAVTKARETSNISVMQDALAVIQRPHNGLTGQFGQVRDFCRGEIDELSYEGTSTYALEWCLKAISES